VHGESSVVPYEVVKPKRIGRNAASANAMAGLAFTRQLSLDEDRVQFEETVENQSALDRPIAVDPARYARRALPGSWQDAIRTHSDEISNLRSGFRRPLPQGRRLRLAERAAAQWRGRSI
jgi:hypothetical protein